MLETNKIKTCRLNTNKEYLKETCKNLNAAGFETAPLANRASTPLSHAYHCVQTCMLSLSIVSILSMN